MSIHLLTFFSSHMNHAVGRDAWGLYEVLKSFCHTKGNVAIATCMPSIMLLCEILGFKDRRPLIGYERVVKGKTYRYPGLINILSQHGLIKINASGDGPRLRYQFEVTLHPPLLTDEQLSQLPKNLQEKHAALLQRCNYNPQAMNVSKQEIVSKTGDLVTNVRESKTSDPDIQIQIWYNDSSKLETFVFKNEKGS